MRNHCKSLSAEFFPSEIPHSIPQHLSSFVWQMIIKAIHVPLCLSNYRSLSHFLSKSLFPNQLNLLYPCIEEPETGSRPANLNSFHIHRYYTLNRPILYRSLHSRNQVIWPFLQPLIGIESSFQHLKLVPDNIPCNKPFNPNKLNHPAFIPKVQIVFPLTDHVQSCNS